MNYSVTCECGARQAVSASQAGSTLKCGCGKSVDVPRLSELRSAVGETPVPLNAVETIEAMLRRGELPSGSVCPLSGRRVDCTVYFRVECERKWVRSVDYQETSGLWIVHLLTLNVFGALRSYMRSTSPSPDEPSEEFGRETSLDLPVRISSYVESAVMGMRNQQELKSLLRNTPIYAELLDEFPDAEVSPPRFQ